jgi:hypothetical protein
MADLLDPRFQDILNDRFNNIEGDMVNTMYSMKPSKLITERFSTLGTMDDVQRFLGSVDYDDVYQGFDVAVTPLEFAKGLQIQRRLFDTDQFNLIEQKPKAMTGALYRTRQKFAARPFNFAFGVDNFFYNHSEGVSLCSNSHITNSGQSTATGFDNLNTTSLNPVTYTAALFQMYNFRGDRAEKITVRPNTLIIPKAPAIAEQAYEIVKSSAYPSQSNAGVANYNQNKTEIIEWIELNSSTNWFMTDMEMQKEQGLYWLDAVKAEMKLMEDFDTLVMKHRLYAVWANMWLDWRWICGSQVS